MAFVETTLSNAQRKENIRVAIRVRPLLPHENHKKEVVYYPYREEGALEVNFLKSYQTKFQTIRIEDGMHLIESKYDKVFRQTSHQNELFDFVKDSIEDVLYGFNSTIFAYGQTGSGKTYTMFGPHWEDNNLGYQNTMGPFNGSNFLIDSSKFGLIPKAIEHVFYNLQMMQQSGEHSFTAYCSFMQIYNEKLFDLFQDKDSQKPLVIREEKYAGIFVEGQSEYVVRNAQECFILLRRGEKNRFTRQTKGNIHSSRSHTIFQLLIESNEPDHRGIMMRGKLNLCDLAGSEKIGKEENMDQQHLLELKTINLSLSSLGKVISALAQGKKTQHIPYRDSKLTRLLQDSLGGNTKTTLIAAVSPLVDCAEETISTLKFADRAKQILVKVQANEMNAADDARIQTLQKEVQYLKDILNMKRKGGANELTTQLLQLKEENSKLKQIAGQISDVERLKQENKLMKIELQKLKVPSMTDGFQQQKQIGYHQNQKSYQGNQQLALIQSVDFQSENGDHVEQNENNQTKLEKKSSFFMTEADYYQQNQSSPNKALPALMNNNQQPPQDRFGNNQFMPKKSSPMKQQNLQLNDPHTSFLKPQSIIDTPLSSLGGIGQDIMSTQSANTNLLQKRGGPLTTGLMSTTNQSMDSGSLNNFSNNLHQMSVQQIADQLENQRIQELKNAALGMKGSLVNNGRCPKCTLKPPCKHYEKIEDLPNIVDVQPSLVKKIQQQMPPLYPNKDNSSFLAVQSKPQQQYRNDSDTTKFTSASSNQTYNNLLSSNTIGTPSNSTFQSNGAAMILQHNNFTQQNSNRSNVNQQLPHNNQENINGLNQRVLKELIPQQQNNQIPYQQQLLNMHPNPSLTTTQTSMSKSPYGANSSTKSGFNGLGGESQILSQSGLNMTQNLTPIQHKQINDDYKQQTSQTSKQQQYHNNYILQSSTGKTSNTSVYNATFYSSNSNPSASLRDKAGGRELSLNHHGNQIMQSSTQSNFLQNSAHKDMTNGGGLQTSTSNDSRSRTNLDNNRKHSQQQRSANFFRLNRQGPSGHGPGSQNNVSNYHPTAAILTDQIQVRIRGKNNVFETKTGSVTRTLNEIQEFEIHKQSMQKTTERLKVLEKLEKFREDRLKKEIEQYEEQKRKEEEEINRARDTEAKRLKYLEKQRSKLDQMRMKKMEEELTQKKDIDKQKEKEKQRLKQMERDKESQKRKIAEYRVKKRQTEELLANANYVDFEDLQNDEDLYSNVLGSNISHIKDNSDKDALEGYVEELSILKGKKRAPPAVQ